MEQGIRWEQRLNSFQRALSQLKKFIEKDELNELEEQGLIQVFEYTYELAWKTLKDYLIYEGIEGLIGSRDTIREAFRLEILEDGEAWMEMIVSRNKSSHTYNEETLKEIAAAIFNKYYHAYVSLEKKLTDYQRHV